jgi:hypothetical protein
MYVFTAFEHSVCNDLGEKAKGKMFLINFKSSGEFEIEDVLCTTLEVKTALEFCILISFGISVIFERQIEDPLQNNNCKIFTSLIKSVLLKEILCRK